MSIKLLNSKGRHPQLEGLKALWDLPDKVLNRILWASTDWATKEQSIGHASEYIDYMTAIIGTENPVEAWESWCIDNNIEHEVINNPYLED